MPTQLSARFEGDPSAHGASWDQLWKEGCTPWDRKTPSPALVDLIEKERVPFATQAVSSSAKSKTALIPGCGRGYDVDYLARALAHRGFAQVIGLDVSKEAVQAAKQYLKDNSSPPGASAEVGDFFKPQDSATWTTGVDLIYDYTFLCALHPSMRTSWGARMAELVVPGGFLITLQCEAFRNPASLCTD